MGNGVVINTNDRIMKGNVFGIDTKNLERVRTAKDFSKYFIRPAKRGKMYVGKYRFNQFSTRFTKELYDEYKKIRLEATRKMFLERKDFVLSREQRQAYVKRAKSVGVTHEQLGVTFDVSPRTIVSDVLRSKKSG